MTLHGTLMKLFDATSYTGIAKVWQLCWVKKAFLFPLAFNTLASVVTVKPRDTLQVKPLLS